MYIISRISCYMDHRIYMCVCTMLLYIYIKNDIITYQNNATYFLKKNYDYYSVFK